MTTTPERPERLIVTDRDDDAFSLTAATLDATEKAAYLATEGHTVYVSEDDLLALVEWATEVLTVRREYRAEAERARIAAAEAVEYKVGDRVKVGPEPKTSDGGRVFDRVPGRLFVGHPGDVEGEVEHLYGDGNVSVRFDRTEHTQQVGKAHLTLIERPEPSHNGLKVGDRVFRTGPHFADSDRYRDYADRECREGWAGEVTGLNSREGVTVRWDYSGRASCIVASSLRKIEAGQ